MKNLLKFVVFTSIFSSILTGCIFIPEGTEDSHLSTKTDSFSLNPPPPATQATAPTPILDKNYTLNAHLYAGFGETVLRVVGYYQRNFIHGSLETKEKITFTSNFDSFSIPVGQHPILGTITIKNETFYVIGPFNKKYALLDKSFYVQKKILFKGANDTRYFALNDYNKLSPRGASLKRVYSSTMDTVPFIDFEVKYDGIKNNQMNFFVKDAVPGSDGRAGSFDTVSYPADSTLIMMRGTKIRVIKADSQRFDYIVIED